MLFIFFKLNYFILGLIFLFSFLVKCEDIGEHANIPFFPVPSTHAPATYFAPLKELQGSVCCISFQIYFNEFLFINMAIE